MCAMSRKAYINYGGCVKCVLMCQHGSNRTAASIVIVSRPPCRRSPKLSQEKNQSHLRRLLQPHSADSTRTFRACAWRCSGLLQQQKCGQSHPCLKGYLCARNPSSSSSTRAAAAYVHKSMHNNHGAAYLGGPCQQQGIYEQRRGPCTERL